MSTILVALRSIKETSPSLFPTPSSTQAWKPALVYSPGVDPMDSIVIVNS